MPSIARAFALACTLAPLTGPIYAAETGSFEFTHCLGGAPQAIKHGDANIANVVMMTGYTRTQTPGALFDNMASQCAVLNGLANGASFAHGFCELADLDNDRLFIEFERKSADGTFRFVAGTGKYQQLKLDGSYTHTKFPQRPGYFQGCAESKGRWQKP